MLITGTSKDYYDRLVTEKGVDNYIVFERGKPTKIDLRAIIMDWRAQLKIQNDFSHWVLIVGYSAWLFEWFEDSGKNKLIQRYYDIDRTLSSFAFWIKPPTLEPIICFRPIKVEIRYTGRHWKRQKNGLDLNGDFKHDIFWRNDFFNQEPQSKKWVLNKFVHENPLLSSLGIQGLVPPEDIWDSIYNYLMKLKEPPDPLPVPDNIKLKAKGFDDSSFKGKFTGRKGKK